MCAHDKNTGTHGQRGTFRSWRAGFERKRFRVACKLYFRTTLLPPTPAKPRN